MEFLRDLGNIVNNDSRRDILGNITGEDAINALKLIRNVVRTVVTCINFSDEDRKLKSGDIIGICRGAYDHYGVYVNDSSVIHYSSMESDTSSDNSIIETDLLTFMRGDNTVFKLWFPEKQEEPSKIVVSQFSSHGLRMPGFARDEEYHLYSSGETVARARSRLGENSYSLFFNNCEHFAIWCKTGISKSHQLNHFLRRQKEICHSWPD